MLQSYRKTGCCQQRGLSSPSRRGFHDEPGGRAES